jgi:hypothetical protein
MGYDLYDGADNYFRANIWSMGELRSVLGALGVLTDEEPADGLDGEGTTDWQSSGRGVPAWKFGSNDGWLVGPAECTAIADAIHGAADALQSACTQSANTAKAYGATFNKEPVTLATPEEVERLVEYTRSFGEFCRTAAGNGGFRVW